MKTIGMALRNLGRNKTRTGITVFSMAFAGFTMILYMSLVAGFFQTLEDNTIGLDLGEFQMHAKGYRSDPDLYKRIEDPASVIRTASERGFNASARLYGYGLAAFGNSSAGVMLRGVDLENEPKVTRISGSVMEGSWLDRADPKGVVVGKKLARTLGLKPGDELVLVSQASDGSMANDLYKVRGVLKTVGEVVDQAGFLMSDDEFRRLLVVPTGAHEVAMTRRNKDVPLDAATAEASKAFPGLEVRNWKQLQPILARMMDMMGTSVKMVIMIAYSAVGMIILNAMLMNVFERIREFGVMKALGVSPARIFLLITAEALLSAFFASVAAAGLGAPAALHYQRHGLDLEMLTTSMNVSGMALDPTLHFRLTPAALGMPIFFMFALVVVATLYPAMKAAVIRPVEALHHQ
ncbi:MAG: ABC transporter permease [Nitrospinae bacterium]|nr:ABC transporter permease [Nitrospinota bacterium]